MQKTILYGVIIIVLTGAILAAGWFFFLRPGGVLDQQNNNTNTVTANVTNTVASNTNLDLETEKGDTETAATVTYNNVKFDFTSSSRVTTWRGEPAPAGKEYLVVYFSPIDADVREATAWIRTDAVLIDGGQTLKPTQLKVVGSGGSSEDSGYFVFTVGTGDKDFKIGFTDTTVALGL